MKKLFLASMVGALILTACGGGDGGSTAAQADPNVPRVATASVDGLMDQINAIRAAGANCGGVAYGKAAPLTWNTQLAQGADLHSQDMARNNFFSHTGSNGSTAANRTGWSGLLGENLSYRLNSAKSPAQGWLESPAHCAILMDPRFFQFGSAGAQGNDGGQYFTGEFGG